MLNQTENILKEFRKSHKILIKKLNSMIKDRENLMGNIKRITEVLEDRIIEYEYDKETENTSEDLL